MPLRLPRRGAIVVDFAMTASCDLPRHTKPKQPTRSFNVPSQLVPVGHHLFRRYSTRRRQPNTPLHVFKRNRMKLFSSTQWDDTADIDNSIHREHWMMMTRWKQSNEIVLGSPSVALNMVLAVPVVSVLTAKPAQNEEIKSLSARSVSKHIVKTNADKQSSKRPREVDSENDAYDPQPQKKPKSVVVADVAHTQKPSSKKAGSKRPRSDGDNATHVLTRRAAAEAGCRLEFSKLYGPGRLAAEAELGSSIPKPVQDQKSLAEPCLLDVPLQGMRCSLFRLGKERLNV